MRWSVLGALVCSVSIATCTADDPPTREELRELKAALREALLRSRMDEGVAALQRIAQSDTKNAALILLAQARSSPQPIYEAARDGLASMNSGEVDTMLSRKCGRGRPEEQLLIADALTERGGGFAEISLSELLNSPDPRVVRAALVGIRRKALKGTRTAVEAWVAKAAPTHAAYPLAQKVLHEISDGKAGEAAPGPACAGAPILGNHVVFVLDTSGSMGEGRLDKAKAAVLEAIARLAPEQKYTVFAFTGKATTDLAEPASVGKGYPTTIDGTQWLHELGPRMEFAKSLWGTKAKAFVESQQPGSEVAFALRALEAGLRVPVAESVVLITGGTHTDVDHTVQARHTEASLLSALRETNRLRRVVISIRAFSGASPVFEQITKEHGGTYAELE